MNNFAQKEFNTIVAGSCILAMNAGFINVVTLAGVFSVTVSHVTGNVSRIAISLFNGDITTLSLVLSILFSFMFGSFVSGYMVGDAKFVLGKSYGYALMLESAMLFTSFITLRGEYIVGEWCAAFACGLQNAMATSYSGLVVRTTHMTGIATDIGNILGQACRKDNHAEVWRLYVHVPILASYCFGGFLGEGAYYLLREHSLLIPCIFTGITATIYLSLPFIQTATETFKGREKRIRADFVPGRGSTLEIRMVGDPRQVGGGIITVADPAKKLPGLNGVSDLEIREFFGDVNDSFEELDLEQAKKRSVVASGVVGGGGGVVAGADVREMQQVQKSAKAYVGVSADEGSSEVLTTGGASEK